jgi:hypothetical protein
MKRCVDERSKKDIDGWNEGGYLSLFSIPFTVHHATRAKTGT